MYLFTLQLPSDWVGLGRTGWGWEWEMQLTENEEMEKKKKRKVVLLAWLLILIDTTWLCFALLCSALIEERMDGWTVALNQVLRSFLD